MRKNWLKEIRKLHNSSRYLSFPSLSHYFRMSTRNKNNPRYIYHNFLIDIYLSNTFNFLRQKHENFENGATNLNLFSYNLSCSHTLRANAKIDARDCLRIINSGEICTEHFVIANFASRACASPRSIPSTLLLFFLSLCNKLCAPKRKNVTLLFNLKIFSEHSISKWNVFFLIF